MPHNGYLYIRLCRFAETVLHETTTKTVTITTTVTPTNCPTLPLVAGQCIIVLIHEYHHQHQ